MKTVSFDEITFVIEDFFAKEEDNRKDNLAIISFLSPIPMVSSAKMTASDRKLAEECNKELPIPETSALSKRLGCHDIGQNLLQRNSRFKSSQRGRRGSLSSHSSDYESDSPYLGGNLEELPTSTSQWRLECLESLGIYYNPTSFSSPLDILDFLLEKTGIFGSLNGLDMEYVNLVCNSMSFNVSARELLELNLEKHQSVLIPVAKQIQMDIKKLYDCSPSTVRHQEMISHFMNAVQTMIAFQDVYVCGSDSYRKSLGDVPEDIFVDIFKDFSKLCKLFPQAGSAFVGRKEIQRKQKIFVSSKPHIILFPGGYSFDIIMKMSIEETRKDADVLSVVEVKSLKHLITKEKEEIKKRPSRSNSDTSLTELPGYPEPEIFQWVKQDILAQHGGELMLLSPYYSKQLKGQMRYCPGIIVIGTEVTFTVLEISNLHWRIMEKKMVEGAKATIYYSEPKDILKKKDRDILVEALSRLNKGWVDEHQ